MGKLAKFIYYYFLIGGMISLIISDATAIVNNEPYTTFSCLLFNLIMLTFAYYQLFMSKSSSSLPEKIVLSLLMLVVVIGSGIVLYLTDFSLSELM